MNLSRRSTVVAGSAMTGATLIPGRAWGANERINIAFVGAGGKGWHAIRSLARNQNVNFIVFADVDQVRAEQARAAHPDVPLYTDFREMLDRHAEIDGVDLNRLYRTE